MRSGAGSWRGQRNLGLLAAAAAAMSWGFTGIFVGESVTGPLLVTFYRLWLAAALTCGACLLRRRLPGWAVLRRAIPAGVFLCANLALYVYAFCNTDVATASVIGAGNVIVAAVAAMIFLHQRLTVTEIAGGVAALAAISVLAVRQARKPLGS